MSQQHRPGGQEPHVLVRAEDGTATGTRGGITITVTVTVTGTAR